jgi:hypothetical protein
VRSSVRTKEGQPVRTLGPSTLNIIFAFGIGLIDSGNSRLIQEALLAALTNRHVPPACEIFTWIWSSFAVLGDFVVPIHPPYKVSAV